MLSKPQAPQREPFPPTRYYRSCLHHNRWGRRHYRRRGNPALQGFPLWNFQCIHSVISHPMAPDQPIRGTTTDVPARLDRLPWSRFHRLVVVALGITWILDGLEVTLAGSVAAALQTSPRLQLTAEQVGLTGSAYLAGAVLG